MIGLPLAKPVIDASRATVYESMGKAECVMPTRNSCPYSPYSKPVKTSSLNDPRYEYLGGRSRPPRRHHKGSSKLAPKRLESIVHNTICLTRKRPTGRGDGTRSPKTQPRAWPRPEHLTAVLTRRGLPGPWCPLNAAMIAWQFPFDTPHHALPMLR
jgi:hypothetical protein